MLSRNPTAKLRGASVHVPSKSLGGESCSPAYEPVQPCRARQPEKLERRVALKELVFWYDARGRIEVEPSLRHFRGVELS